MHTYEKPIHKDTKRGHAGDTEVNSQELALCDFVDKSLQTRIAGLLYHS